MPAVLLGACERGQIQIPEATKWLHIHVMLLKEKRVTTTLPIHPSNLLSTYSSECNVQRGTRISKTGVEVYAEDSSEQDTPDITNLGS